MSIQQEHKSAKDGRHFLRTFSPVREPGSPDRITGVIIVSKDVTERKLVEDALRRSEKLLRDFINSSRPRIFLKDEQFRYLLVNTSFLEFLGKKEEEVIGKTDFEMMSGEMADKWQGVCRKMLESGALVSSEEIIADRVYESRLFPVELSDGRTGISGRVNDITDKVQADREKKKLEVQLIQSQKMEAIGTLAGGRHCP